MRKLKQAELGAAVGLSEASISRIESGRQGVNAERVEAIAVALGLTMSEFYGDPPQLPGDTTKATAAANG